MSDEKYIKITEARIALYGIVIGALIASLTSTAINYVSRKDSHQLHLQNLRMDDMWNQKRDLFKDLNESLKLDKNGNVEDADRLAINLNSLCLFETADLVSNGQLNNYQRIVSSLSEEFLENIKLADQPGGGQGCSKKDNKQNQS